MPDLDCDHRPACPACPRFGSPELPRQEVAQLQSLVAGPDPIVVEELVGRAKGYRTRARLSYRRYQDRGRFGVFEGGSHQLAPIPECSLHHPLINILIEQLEELAEAARLSAYDEVSCGGLLRGAQVMVNPLSKKVQLTLIINRLLGEQPLGARLKQLVESIENIAEVESLWLSEHVEKNNVFLGQKNYLQFGPEFLELNLGGQASFYPPDSFTQANLELHELSLERIVAAVIEKGGPTELRVGEFYAGSGSIGLPLIARGYELYVNEISAGSMVGFERGLQQLRLQGNIKEPKVFLGDAQAFIERLQGLDLLIVDPPRKGLGAPLLNAIIASSITRLIYLSCGLNALLKEAKQLKSSGFEPVQLSALGYFPYTQHIESLVVFERKSTSFKSASGEMSLLI